MTKKTLQLETLTCPSCMAKIQGALKKTEGVKSHDVLFNSSRVKVEFDESVVDIDTIKNSIETIGYSVLSVK